MRAVNRGVLPWLRDRGILSGISLILWSYLERGRAPAVLLDAAKFFCKLRIRYGNIDRTIRSERGPDGL